MNGDTNRLVRAIDGAEAHDQPCWYLDCEEPTSYRISTPHGPFDACDAHSDELIASLPESFLQSWESMPSLALIEALDEDDIPF